ncbi:hypothetical protein F7725_027681 [Dissostichus mawsoni]|uniref:Platelet-derived growth factor receptor-like protein n=1 Tax=Dissostichus mawsoni TaxID=36200 RepID=A0A7J5XE38_DISMA|nr:hypothetical protein F7725_027681 [Dissostichus mawsoni]
MENYGNTKPTITPAGSHLVVPLNAPFELRCQGEKEMQWQREDRPKVRGEIKITGMSTVRISRAQPAHMGRYICLEEMSKAQTSIYVYVKDPVNPFRKSMVDKILTREGDTASISCLATDPSLDNLRLETCSSRALASGLQFSASLEKGITIFNTQKSYEGCYVCTGRLKEENVRSFQYNLIVRPVPIAPPVIEMQASKRVILIRDEGLSLTCNTTNVNGEIHLKWVTPPGSGAVWYPQQPPKVGGVSRILEENFTHVRSATLTITEVGPQDVGRYRCEAENEKGVSSQSVWLDVYEKGFINLTPAINETIHVRSGENLPLNVEMEAYPKLHWFSWSFMGQQLRNTTDHVITTHVHEYRYSSELRLVRLKMSESGVYTFQASNGDASVNHTFTIFVISKPEIVSHEGPVDGQVRCVAEGFPAPQITWYYCEQPYARCSQQVNATQEEHNVITVTLFSPMFGKTEVESRVNVSRGRFSTLECVATVEGEQAYTLFSISERTVTHDLFTPLLIGSVSAAGILCLVLIILFYKYMQLRPDCSFPLHSDSLNGYMTMRPSAAGNPPFSSSSEKRRSIRKGKQASHSSNISILKYTANNKSLSCFVLSGGSYVEADEESEMFEEDGLSLDTEDLLSFSHQVAKGMEFLAYHIMRSCWDADPFNRPPFRKVVERIEQQLTDATKHIYLNFSSRLPVTPRAREEQSSESVAPHSHNSAGNNSAPTQPLLVQHEVFLEGTTLRAQRV